jgi:hypothetical protein
MTPQELAELPVGTRVRFFIDWNEENSEIPARTYAIYDYGTVGLAGVITHVTWDDGPTSLIDTKSQVWESFIADIEVICE